MRVFCAQCFAAKAANLLAQQMCTFATVTLRVT